MNGIAGRLREEPVRALYAGVLLAAAAARAASGRGAGLEDALAAALVVAGGEAVRAAVVPLAPDLAAELDELDAVDDEVETEPSGAGEMPAAA